eukprot:CAMPEP_0179978842 /NCGR_PEP_ID=MMETSP0983-20121128/40937_1 /TAXON_ID=483367 /ORGANISM="non described non described, Strain CCMP 2436" /LENGTH=97 /DNA_ID=CAMNT_0021896381 /DNA_START=41 /DNA_END=334 /DNA_ORIENTATION=+
MRYFVMRVGLTCGCALVVLVVPELELLIGLLGALCMASLSALPFLASIRLHLDGTVPIARGRLGLHALLLAFCLLAAVTGTFRAVADIAVYLHGHRE